MKDIVEDTKFNGTAVFGSGTFTFQVGANDTETIATSVANLSPALGTAGTGGIAELTGLSNAAQAVTSLRRAARWVAWRPSTARSRTCRRLVRTSARSRTVSSIV